MQRTDLERVGHIFVLWAFAVAQPLYALFNNPEHLNFLTMHRASPADIGELALVLSLGLPALVAGVGYLAGRFLPNGQIVYQCMAGVLLLLFLMPVTSQNLFFAALLAAILLWLYLRKPAFGQYLLFLLPAVLIFPLLFLFASPVSSLVFPPKTLLPVFKNVKPIPVVMVILDELPVTSLMNGKRLIDEKNFPNFARLARTSTWYRNAVTVSDRTSTAVPAILKGSVHGDPPSDHQHNLFTLLARSHRMHVFESVTQLCPVDVCRRQKGDGVFAILRDLGIVYVHMILPPQYASGLGRIDQDWGSFGLVRQSLRMRENLFAEFMASMPQELNAALYLIHVELPHVPWGFLPSGKIYEDGREGNNPFGMKTLSDVKADGHHPMVWESDWLAKQGYQRHLLQLGYTDMLLGQLLDQLDDTGLMDPALVIVVADHGISFNAKTEVRAANRQNLADIAAVPLLIKYPEQRKGKVSDDMIQTTEILSVISDMLGIAMPPKKQEPFKLYGETTLPPLSFSKKDLAKKYQTLAMKEKLFPENFDQKKIDRLGPYPKLFGTQPNVQESRTMRVKIENLQQLNDLDLGADFLPARWVGVLDARQEAGFKKQPVLAFSLNGKIVAQTMALPINNQPGLYQFYVMIPETAFHYGRNQAEVFWVKSPRGLFKIPLQ